MSCMNGAGSVGVKHLALIVGPDLCAGGEVPDDNVLCKRAIVAHELRTLSASNEKVNNRWQGSVMLELSMDGPAPIQFKSGGENGDC